MTSLISAIRPDARQWRYTRLMGLLLISVALIVLAQNYYKHSGSEAYSVGLSLAYNLIIYASFAFFISPIIRITDWIAQSKLSKPARFGLHVLISLGLVLLHMVLCNLFLYAIGLTSTAIFPRFITKYLTNVVHVHLLVYWAVLAFKSFGKDEQEKPIESVNEQSKPEYWTRFEVNQKGRTIYLSFDEVFWIEAEDHYQKLHTAQGCHLIKASMKHLVAVLPPDQFQRVHRSSIVNLDKVIARSRMASGKSHQLELSDGTLLKLSAAYASKVRK